MAGISSSYSRDLVNWTPKDYAYITLSTDQTTGISDEDPIKFNTLVRGNINFSPSTYRVTLKAGKTYRIQAHLLMVGSGSTGTTRYQIYDVTNAAIVGLYGYNRVVSSSSNVPAYSPAVAIVTPTSDTVYEVRLSSVTALTTISATYSFWEVQELDTFAPSRAKWQYEYVSPALDLTVTSAKAGFVLTRAKGVFYKTNNGKWRLEGNIAWTITAGTSADITIGGIDLYATQHFPCTTLSGVSMYRCTIGASGATSITSSANATNFYATFTIELLNKPTGYGIPSDV